MVEQSFGGQIICICHTSIILLDMVGNLCRVQNFKIFVIMTMNVKIGTEKIFTCEHVKCQVISLGSTKIESTEFVLKGQNRSSSQISTCKNFLLYSVVFVNNGFQMVR